MSRCAELLEKIIALPSPGTFEDSAQKLVLAEMKKVCDCVETDIYGNVFGTVNADAPARLLLAAHVDEIGLMVSHVDDKGFVYVNLLGGTRPDAMIGQRVQVHAAKGPVLGVVGRLHGPSPKEEITVKNLYLDIGATSRAEALRRVRVGDTATCAVGFDRLGGDRVAGRGMDDRCGVVAILEAMRLVRADRRKPKVAVCALSNVQEEGGKFRGSTVCAHRLAPHAALAVDVVPSRDYPKTEVQLSGECRVGGGPTLSLSLTTNRAVNRMLEGAAKARKIRLQYAVEPGATGTDGDAIASAGKGVATGVVSIPCRYVHSPSEVISLRDLEDTARLIAEFALRLPAQPDFKPF